VHTSFSTTGKATLSYFTREDLEIGSKKGIKIDPYELKEYILEIAGNDIYSDIKIIVGSDFGNYRPEILVSLKDSSNANLLAFIQKSLKDKTLLTFDVKHTSRDYFQRGENNKVKFVEYVDKK
jgi:hypothetical protein